MFFFRLLVSILLPASAFALYNGNPSNTLLPEKNFFFPDILPISLKFGFQYNDVWNRKLKGAKQFRIQDQLGTITVDLIDRLEVYAALGITKMDWKVKSSGKEERFSAHHRFAWEIGGRVLFASYGRLDFGIDAEAYFVHPHTVLEKIPFIGTLISQSTTSSLHYNEWQVGAGFSYRLPLLIPYIGVKYARAHAAMRDPIQNLKSRKFPGLFLGMALAPPLSFAVNVEARFFDETAMTAAVEVKF